MAMKLLAANNAYSTLSGSISASDTTISVAPGTASLFPVPVPGTSYFLLTLKIAASPTIYEIVQVTDVSGDDLTVIRGQEGTTAIAWSAGAVAANLFTAGSFDVLVQGEELSGSSGAASIGASSGLTIQGEINRSLRQTGTFAVGGTINYAQELYAYNGILWRWGGSFPKTVTAGSTPSTDGISPTTWIEVGSANLKATLAGTAAGQGSQAVGFLETGSVSSTVSAGLLARPRSSDLLAANGSGLGYQFSSDATLRNMQVMAAEKLSIMDFVLPSDNGNYSLALNRIFTKYVSATSFQVAFPSGRFSLKTQAVYNGSALVALVGQQATTLSLEFDSTAANLAITSVRRTVIQDMEIEATQTTAAATKTAIYINCTGQDVSHTLVNVRCSTTISKASTGIIFFDLVNVSLSNFSSCYVRYFGAFSKTEFSNNIGFRVSATTKISTDSRFDNCSVVGCEYPYLITPPNATSGYLEGIAWNNCTVVDCLYGPAIRGDNSQPYKSPMYRWIGGHIFAYKTCLDVYWVSQIIVDGAILYMVYDATISGSLGRSAITLNETVTSMIDNTIIRLVNQPNDGNSQGVYVGTNCNYTKITSVAVYTASQGKGVLSVPSSKYTRVFDISVLYSGTAPAAAVSLGGTSDLNMGSTNVYPQ